MCAYPDETKRSKQQPQKKTIMETKKVTPIAERNEIVQDVLDRLLYLSPEQMAKYKEALNVLHRLYSVQVEFKNQIRIYPINKNLQ